MSAKASALWRVPCFVITALVGASLPFGEGCGGCPEFNPDPLYRIVSDPPGWVGGSGSVRVTEDAFVVSYTTLDGSRWEVEYRRREDP